MNPIKILKHLLKNEDAINMDAMNMAIDYCDEPIDVCLLAIKIRVSETDQPIKHPYSKGFDQRNRDYDLEHQKIWPTCPYDHRFCYDWDSCDEWEECPIEIACRDAGEKRAHELKK